MTYKNKIDEDYQAQIDEFIKNKGITELSVTNNKIGETPVYRKKTNSTINRIKQSSAIEQSPLNKLKKEFDSGNVVRNSDYKEMGFKHKKSIAVCVCAMRKAGWEIDTIYGIGYQLVKKGGYIHW